MTLLKFFFVSLASTNDVWKGDWKKIFRLFPFWLLQRPTRGFIIFVELSNCGALPLGLNDTTQMSSTTPSFESCIGRPNQEAFDDVAKMTSSESWARLLLTTSTGRHYYVIRMTL